MDIKEILERIKADPDYRAQLQSELAFPMYQPGHAGQPVEQIDKLEASFGSIDDLINSIKIDKNVDQDSASDYSNYEAPSSVEIPSFDVQVEPKTDLQYNKAVTEFDPTQLAIKAYHDSEADKYFDKTLDDKIDEDMVAGLNNFINEAYTPHAMDYLADSKPEDIVMPSIQDEISNLKFNSFDYDKKPFEEKDVIDIQGVQPEDDIEHYEQAIKVLQERKANRVKALENARANMAAAAWMYRKNPSLLSALFSEKSAERIAKAGKESQKAETDKANMKKVERIYNELSDEVQSYDKADKEQTKLIKKLAREYRNACEDAGIDTRFDDDLDALGIDYKKLRNLELDWKKNEEAKETSEKAPEAEAITTQTVKEKLNSEEMKALIDKGKTSDIDNTIKELNGYKDQLKNNNKENDNDKQATSQAIDDIITKLNQRKKKNADDAAAAKAKKEASKSFDALKNLTGPELKTAIEKHNKTYPKYKLKLPKTANGIAEKDGWK